MPAGFPWSAASYLSAFTCGPTRPTPAMLASWGSSLPLAVRTEPIARACFCRHSWATSHASSKSCSDVTSRSKAHPLCSALECQWHSRTPFSLPSFYFCSVYYLLTCSIICLSCLLCISIWWNVNSMKTVVFCPVPQCILWAQNRACLKVLIKRKIETSGRRKERVRTAERPSKTGTAEGSPLSDDLGKPLLFSQGIHWRYLSPSRLPMLGRRWTVGALRGPKFSHPHTSDYPLQPAEGLPPVGTWEHWGCRSGSRPHAANALCLRISAVRVAFQTIHTWLTDERTLKLLQLQDQWELCSANAFKKLFGLRLIIVFYKNYMSLFYKNITEYILSCIYLFLLVFTTSIWKAGCYFNN